MKKLVLLTMAICLADISLSQTGYREGYVVTSAGDTLHGLVDYREDSKAYKSCNFKESKDQNTITYDPTSIVGYGFVKSKFFESREVSMKDQSPEHVFLEVIIKGLASLNKYEETFFLEKDGSVHPLVNESKEVYVDGKPLLMSTNQYIGTLNMLLYDCPDLKASIQKIRLTDKSLSNLVEAYNKCKGVPVLKGKQGGPSTQTLYTDKKPWAKAIIGITVGLNLSQIDFDNTINHEHLVGPFEISGAPLASFSLDLLSPKLSDRISIHSEFQYYFPSNYRYNGRTYGRPDVVTIEIQQYKIQAGIRYVFSKMNPSPYVNIGLSGTTISSNSSWTKDLYNLQGQYLGEARYSNEEVLSIKNHYGVWGGFGILMVLNNKLNSSLELRYEQTNGLSAVSTPNSTISNFQIAFGLRTK